MDSSDEHEDGISKSLEEIHQLELEALRRAGVAKEKERGLEIESTEAIRLFREATGYLLRLRALREDVRSELDLNDEYNAQHVLGHLDDYNRILDDIRRNPSFKAAVQSFQGAEYDWDTAKGKYRVKIEGRTAMIADVHQPRHKPRQTNVPMEGSGVESFVLPRLVRVTTDVENSLIGRCASGKRPG